MISLFVIAIFILRELPCPDYRQESEDSDSMHDTYGEDDEDDQNYCVTTSCTCKSSGVGKIPCNSVAYSSGVLLECVVKSAMLLSTASDSAN